LKQPALSVREASRLYRTSVTAGICTRFVEIKARRQFVNNFFIFFERSRRTPILRGKSALLGLSDAPSSERLLLFF
jgi:hypothetical protein